MYWDSVHYWHITDLVVTVVSYFAYSVLLSMFSNCIAHYSHAHIFAFLSTALTTYIVVPTYAGVHLSISHALLIQFKQVVVLGLVYRQQKNICGKKKETVCISAALSLWSRRSIISTTTQSLTSYKMVRREQEEESGSKKECSIENNICLQRCGAGSVYNASQVTWLEVGHY